ncbi:MAG: ATP-binding cassette domain-containing protein [Firmicutes bacterium]|nr:ATP-binding cassette domain-containing protein [Bacillota bacterium]
MGIGFVFSFFNLINSFNAEDNILVPLLLAGIDKHAAQQRVDELLEQMGMSHRRKHYPWQLSGGEQQRVAIARALANSPELILADEPTGNLDQKTGDIILDLLSSIHQSGKTVIVVSHDPKMVSRATQVHNLET